MDATNAQMPSMGVLHFKEGANNFRLSRHLPSADIAPFVKHYWVVSWDLTGQAPYLQHVVPNPCVNMVVEMNKTAIYAPAKSKFSYLLREKGRVFGVKFKPGGFYPFLKSAVSKLGTQGIRIEDVFHLNSADFEYQMLSQEAETNMVQLAESVILKSLPKPDNNIDLVQQVIDQIIEDPHVTKVDDICERIHINKRKLQRIFEQYVGVTPKWVIKLYRLQNAAEKIEADTSYDWSQLSAELGYYDQAHFIKDFKSIVGKTPAEYALSFNRQ